MRRAMAVLATIMIGGLLVAPPAGGVLAPSVGEASRAVELRGPVPDWYGPDLDRQVAAAAERGEGVPLPDDVELPASALLFTGIRPGSWMLSPSWCTMNFVFGSPGDWYIGTAGHCAAVGDEVTILALPGVLMNIGTTVKSVDDGIGNDFALIDVRPEMEGFVNPSMAVVGGPTGSAAPTFGDPVVHVGHGVAVGTGGTPRAGVVSWTGADGNPVPLVGGADDANGYGWTGAGSPGDSGSPVRGAAGAAVGNFTHLVVGTAYAPAALAGTTIGRMVAIAGKPLAAAPLAPNPL